MSVAGTIRIATRASVLAMAQARAVARLIAAPCELVSLTTAGDRAPGSLAEIGGKGLFTAELEAALRSGHVHLAVHSAKDLPAEMHADMVIAAVPAREDPRDALVSAAGWSPADLPAGARVGTSSPRRACQLAAERPDVAVVVIRGNVETRLAKVQQGSVDGVMLAMAGLNRLGLTDHLGEKVRPMDVEAFAPAAGQGALAVQCMAADAATRDVLARISDPDSAAALAAERGVVRGLGATCRSAVGVHVARREGGWTGWGMVAAPGEAILRASVSDDSAEVVGRSLLARLIDNGAMDLLHRDSSL